MGIDKINISCQLFKLKYNCQSITHGYNPKYFMLINKDTNTSSDAPTRFKKAC